LGRANVVRFLLPNRALPGRTRLLTRHSAGQNGTGRRSRAHVFPAWPKEWNGRFTLAAHGAFLVSASIRGGSVEFDEPESQSGAECRLRNPFAGSVDLYRDRKKSTLLSGATLRFHTRKGERLVLVAAGTDPASVRRAVPEA
jgi:hypothetical protein